MNQGAESCGRLISSLGGSTWSVSNLGTRVLTSRGSSVVMKQHELETAPNERKVSVKTYIYIPRGQLDVPSDLTARNKVRKR